MPDPLYIYEVVFLGLGKLRSTRLVTSSKEMALKVLENYYGPIQVVTARSLGLAENFKPE